jgi:hypothetical protein
VPIKENLKISSFLVSTITTTQRSLFFTILKAEDQFVPLQKLAVKDLRYVGSKLHEKTVCFVKKQQNTK